MTTQQTERFVSLHGFFAFHYPSTWHNETDEAGHYVFYNNNGGQGVTRIMILPNEFEGDNAATLMLEEVYKQNTAFNPELLIANNNKFVYFVKEHDINNSTFTVYYWVTTQYDKVVLFTFTQQTALKDLPQAIAEKSVVENMIGSFEFLSGEHHG
jgi:hypothetical protein